MSAYGIVPSDLDVRLSPQRRIDLTDSETAPTGTENVGITNAAITNAEALFHGAAGIYYVTPIVPSADATPAEALELVAIVKRMIVGITAYDLMSRKPEWLQQSNESTFWGTLFKANQAWLAGFTDPKRLTKLRAAQEVIIQEPTTGGARTLSDYSIFSRDSMKGY
jgi:hypothetical protein